MALQSTLDLIQRYKEGGGQPLSTRNIGKAIGSTYNPDARVDRTAGVGLLGSAEQKLAEASSLDTAKKALEDANLFAAQQRQARIDAINKTFAPRIQRQEEENKAQMSRVEALNFKRGILGSGADTTKLGEQRGLNEKALQAIEDEKALLIQQAFDAADTLATERAKLLTEQAKGAAQANVDLYKAQAERAMNTLATFGKVGVSYEDLLSTDPNTIKTLREVSGLSDAQIKNSLIAAAPEGTYQWNQAQAEGNKMYVPKLVNGKVTLETIDLPYNAGKRVKDTVKSGENVYLIYEDGTTKLLGGGSGGTEKPLSILDIARYNELYPEAGVTAGDSETVANQKIQTLNSPEAKLRKTIMTIKDSGNDYETVVSEIEKDPTIKDKETAKKIASEVYGVSPETVPDSKIEQEIASMKNTSASDKRFLLRQRGYSNQEINNSSVGNIIDQISEFVFGS